MGQPKDQLVLQLGLMLVILLTRSTQFPAKHRHTVSLLASRFLSASENEDEEELSIVAYTCSSLWPYPEGIPPQRVATDLGWYIKPRNVDFWEHFKVDSLGDEQRWGDMVRVSRGTFDYIVEMLTPALETNVPLPFRNIPNRVFAVDRQVAIVLHRLATGSSVPSIMEMFGVSEASVYLAVKRRTQKGAAHATAGATLMQG
ncbi:hypothetical protein KFL_000190160 [Klebsormidium nitens]|uniref:Uncharacterized protein n=1 Tax=Klebsormidium nitens TaxID=105231 RepID=A0A1Y1HQG2_KLENI|nr:hypothetical protein KFL_000190160 [Klebsormidium nitens]|eukprot:GAQ78797.1 hypothetical protein KFL_000190160 [Klebsormidium nitens]